MAPLAPLLSQQRWSFAATMPVALKPPWPGPTLLQTPPGSAEGRRCAMVRISRRRSAAPTHVDLRVAVAGGVDGGKSTLVGVLSHGAGGTPALDNGRGSSRMQVGSALGSLAPMLPGRCRRALSACAWGRPTQVQASADARPHLPTTPTCNLHSGAGPPARD